MSLRDKIEEIFEYYDIEMTESGYKSILFVCPFHQQGVHRHNAVIYVDNGGWKCFNPGCNSRGFLQTIVRRIEKCNNEKALSILKDRFSLDLSELVFEEQDTYNREIKIFGLPKFYEPIAPDNPYLEAHGFTWANLNRLKVGQAKFDPSILIAPYIVQGRNVGYGVKPTGERMNFPRDFDVNRYLYGRDLASVHDYVYVVEGQRDDWRISEFGLPVTGLNNAKCSSFQFSTLIKLWKKVILCLDGDGAGAKGTKILFKRLEGLMPVEAVLMPYKIDPEMIRTKEEFLSLPRTKDYQEVCRYEEKISMMEKKEKELARKEQTDTEGKET